MTCHARWLTAAVVTLVLASPVIAQQGAEDGEWRLAVFGPSLLFQQIQKTNRDQAWFLFVCIVCIVFITW